MYHSIRHDGDPLIGADAVSVEMFAEQMRWLREGSHLAVLSLSAGVERLAGGRFDATVVAVTFDDGYLDLLTLAAPILERYAIPFTAFVLTGFVTSPPARNHFLDLRALRELAAVPGASIGSHGHSHRPLTRLDEKTMAEELQRSVTSIADAVGVPPVGLSYPYGAVDQRVLRNVRAAGFAIGATSIGGANRLGASPLLLRRTEIAGVDALADFTGKIRGDFDWYGVKQRLYSPVPPLSRV